jgi:hypothetical protein
MSSDEATASQRSTTDATKKPACEMRTFWITFSVSPGGEVKAESSAREATRSGMLDDWRGDGVASPMSIPEVKIRLELGFCHEIDASGSTAGGSAAHKPAEAPQAQGTGERDGQTRG